MAFKNHACAIRPPSERLCCSLVANTAGCFVWLGYNQDNLFDGNGDIQHIVTMKSYTSCSGLTFPIKTMVRQVSIHGYQASHA